MRTRDLPLAELHGRAVFLSFLYTRCTDRCPLLAAKLAELARETDPHRVAVVAITVDPRRDSAKVLWRYREAFSSSTGPLPIYATGNADAVTYLERRLDVELDSEGPSGDGEHADVAYVLDPNGRIERVVTGSAWAPSESVELTGEAQGTSVSPLLAVKLWLNDVAERCSRAVPSFGPGTAVLLVLVLALAIGVPLVRAV